ncbi:hypothetical protein KCU65_g4275, partial [Aureobasidium melanogenum]
MSIKKGNKGGTRRFPRGGWRDAINRIEHRAIRVAFAPSRPATIEPRAPVDLSLGPPSPPASPPPPLPARGPVLRRYSPPPLGWRGPPAPPPAPRPRAANLPLGFVPARPLPPCKQEEEEARSEGR